MRSFLLIAILSSILPISYAFANHGPGTSGGGTLTESGETLAEQRFTFSVREDYTNYDNVSRERAEENALELGEFDSIDDAFLTSFTVAYGITNDLQIDMGIGWYSGRGFLDSELEHHEEEFLKEEVGEVESSTADPEGLTDLTLRMKYRVLKGRPGNLALIGGAIFPIGDDNERLDNGEKLEPSSQPGTGRFGYQFGLAYSRYLTSHITLDTSSVYTMRVERNDFDIGDRADTGLTFAYRITDDIKSFPQISVFGEANYFWLGKDKSEEGTNFNSGGDTLFLTPGIRVRFMEDVAITVAPSFPVIQDLNGEQVETDFKVFANLTAAL